MNNPDGDNVAEIKAYLRISIAIQGPGDNAVSLAEAPITKNASLPTIMPASLAKAYKQINICLLEAQGIPDMDLAVLSTTTTNCFVSAEWGKKKL